MKDLNSRVHGVCCSIWCNAIAQEKPKSSVRVDTRSFKSKPPWLRIMTESLEDNCGFHHPSLRSPFAVTPQDSTTSPYKLVDQMKCCARYYPQSLRKSNSLFFHQRQHPMFPCKLNNSQLKFEDAMIIFLHWIVNSCSAETHSPDILQFCNKWRVWKDKMSLCVLFSVLL